MSTPMHKLPKNRTENGLYDYRIWKEEVEKIITLTDTEHGPRCPHTPFGNGRFQISWIKKKNGESQQVIMCPTCYQKLRDAGLAHIKGTWERK